MARFGAARTASILITLFGAVSNAILTIQVLAAWRSIRWETESEWESRGDKWQLDGVKVIWGLLFIYFASAASVCAVGLHGVLKSKPSHVRFYRDYSIADFSLCTLCSILMTYAAFLKPARAGVCEEFSHHPELMRDMLEMGLNIENCELWLERAVFGLIAFLFVMMVVRLHFLLAVSNYYSHLARHSYHHHQRTSSCSTIPACSSNSAGVASGSTHSLLHSHSSSQSHPLQRIYLLPNTQHHTLAGSTGSNDPENGALEMVYAPVPRSSLPKDLQEQATEAWVSTSNARLADTEVRHHNHHHHRRHRNGHGHYSRHRSSSRETTGRIKLDIAEGEGLLPVYEPIGAEGKV
ncbi:unnamed protein product [Cyclocybe aegerita]|uniref:Uncharacterized protein n=1 Tax=Cyclocybe aegerita TaxID=1973307 RepID=A0A8S0W611_CYCAE|nr:unnamed protein product [Cyclocybe aegerita]